MDYFTVEELHRIAVELLRNGEELQNILDRKDSPGLLERIPSLLSALCETVSRLHELLGDPNSPLADVVRRAAGIQYSAVGHLERFLTEHSNTLKSLGISPVFVDRVRDVLREQVDARGEHDLENPEILDPEVVEIVRDFSTLVCEVSRIPEVTREMLEGVAEGVIGTALVVVDITSAATVAPHDFTGWTLVKVIKSVWSGTTKIRRAIGRLKEAIAFFRGHKETERRQAELKKRPPAKSPLDKKSR
ncbi:hypothetical protein KF840_23480 [bacterium]|nr:hypothetical protein [bacterium]